MPVVEDAFTLQTDGSVAYDVSNAGDRVYLKASEFEERPRVVWVARDGTRREAFPKVAGCADPRLSPDGPRIALTRTQPEPWSLWLFTRQRALFHAVETPAYDVVRS